MRKISLLLFIFFIINIISVTAINTTFSKVSFKALTITLVNQESDPVSPGDYVEVRFKVENQGSENADDVQFEVLPEYPFSLDPGVSAVKLLGSIHGRQVDDIGVIVKYKLRVDENAIEGDNELKVRYKVKNENWIELDPFLIDIREKDAVVDVSSLDISSDRLIPGQESMVTLTLTNYAESLMRNIKVKLDLTNIPISPIGSTNEKIIEKLNKNSMATMPFTLMPDADAASKVYKVPLLIEYFDEQNNKFTKNSTIGLVVEDMPSFTVSLEESTAFTSRANGKVTFSISNTGTSELKFVTISLFESQEYEILSPNKIYVGNLESDDFETAEFTVYPKTKENVTFNLEITYKDSFNNEFTEQEDIVMPLYSSSEAKRYGLIKGSNTLFIFIVIIVLAIAGYYFYKKYKKRKMK